MNNKQKQFIKELRQKTASGFFATRDSVDEALELTIDLNKQDSSNGTMTSTIVLLNTVLQELEMLEK